jgi:hypothetical protein
MEYQNSVQEVNFWRNLPAAALYTRSKCIIQAAMLYLHLLVKCSYQAYSESLNFQMNMKVIVLGQCSKLEACSGCILS